MNTRQATVRRVSSRRPGTSPGQRENEMKRQECGHPLAARMIKIMGPALVTACWACEVDRGR